jgi:hypothetical protein
VKSAVETIKVVLDAKLLKAADSAAKRQKLNRSALIRQALQEHLKRLRVLDLEERDRRGYQARPQRIEDYRPWEEAAAWPAQRGRVSLKPAKTVIAEDTLAPAEAKKVRRGLKQLKEGKTLPWNQVKHDLGL